MGMAGTAKLAGWIMALVWLVVVLRVRALMEVILVLVLGEDCWRGGDSGPDLAVMRAIRTRERRIKKGLTACAVMAAKLQKISLASALRIFEAKVRPIITYALHLYSHRLTAEHMTELDKVKHRFLKKRPIGPTDLDRQRTAVSSVRVPQARRGAF